MRWLFEFKGEPVPRLSEASVDCNLCQVHPPLFRISDYTPENKCCEFSPFLSSFAAGRLLSEGVDLEKVYQEAQGELVTTQLGLLHSHAHRAKGRKLCGFYNSENRSCKIWMHRPATCFCFFCVSEKSQQWKDLEMDLLETEAGLLREWHQHEGGSDEDWARWGLIMDENPLIEIPESLLWRQWDQAVSSYQKSYQWLLDRGTKVRT